MNTCTRWSGLRGLVWGALSRCTHSRATTAQLILGTNAWTDHRPHSTLRAITSLQVPRHSVVTNWMSQPRRDSCRSDRVSEKAVSMHALRGDRAAVPLRQGRRIDLVAMLDVVEHDKSFNACLPDYTDISPTCFFASVQYLRYYHSF